MAKRFKGDFVGRMVLIYFVVMFLIITIALLLITGLKWNTGLPKLFGA